MTDFVPIGDFQPRNITHIVVHHSATADTTLENFDAIFNYHTNVKGWRDIGYHAVCEFVAGSTVAQYGRPEHVQGAHVAGFNDYTLGICIVGNFSVTMPNVDLLRYAAWRVIAPWCVQYSIPVENIVGHSEVPGTDTECPGLNLDMDRFRELISEYILKQTFPDEGGDGAAIS